MKTKKIKSVICLILVAVITLLSTGCSNNDNSDSTDTLVIAYSGTNSLNPLTAQTWAEHSILYLTQTQLVRFYDKQIEFDAAESFEHNDNFTSYTFHIREGLKWEDGSTLDANDFAYGIYCVLSPEFASPRAGAWEIIKNAAVFSKGELADWTEVGVKVIDDYTLEFKLEYPDNSFEKTIASKHLYPIEESFFKNLGDTQTYGTATDKILSSGAYTVEEMIFDQKISLTKNTAYWNASEVFQTTNISLLEIADANTQVAMFKNGDVDVIAGVDGRYTEDLSDYAYNVIGGGFEFMWFNQNGSTDETGKLLSNINFRKALTYALNRNDIAMAANSANMPANFIVDPCFTASSGKPFYIEYPVNSVAIEGDAKAAQNHLKAALNELGYATVEELPEIKLVTFAYDTFKNECETIMNQWKTVLGIENVQLIQQDAGVAIGTFYALDYDIFCVSWESNNKPSDIMQSLAKGGEANIGIWHNKEFEDLLTSALNETDIIEQEKLIQQAEQVFIDDCGIVPLYVEGWIHAVQNNVEGYQVGNGGDGFEFQNLTVKK